MLQVRAHICISHKSVPLLVVLQLLPNPHLVNNKQAQFGMQGVTCSSVSTRRKTKSLNPTSPEAVPVYFWRVFLQDNLSSSSDLRYSYAFVDRFQGMILYLTVFSVRLHFLVVFDLIKSNTALVFPSSASATTSKNVLAWHCSISF